MDVFLRSTEVFSIITVVAPDATRCCSTVSSFGSEGLVPSAAYPLFWIDLVGQADGRDVHNHPGVG